MTNRKTMHIPCHAIMSSLGRSKINMAEEVVARIASSIRNRLPQPLPYVASHLLDGFIIPFALDKVC